jgi:hypothetical protein
MAIATFARGQAIMMERMSSLERVVGSLQFDMTGVRDDMEAVRKAMDKLAGQVCDTRAGAVDAERGREQVSVDVSPLEHWKGKEPVAGSPKPPSPSSTRGYGHSGGGSAPIPNDGVDDAENHTDNTDVNLDIVNSKTGWSGAGILGRSECPLARAAMAGLWSGPWTDTTVSIEKEPLEDDSHQRQMSSQSTPLSTPAIGRTMWTDFQAAVSDWPPTTAAATGFEEGWVAAKKGRWDMTEYAKAVEDPIMPGEGAAYAATNFKFLPLRGGEHGRREGGVVPSPTDCNAGGSRKVGNGTGRGSGRGRGLPLVSPRFHTTVRAGSPSNLNSV